MLKRNTQLSAGCDIFISKDATVTIGERTYLNKRCIISSHEKITIGKNCLFGPDVKLYDNNHLIKAGEGVVHGQHYTRPILIGDNCWLAANVVVLSGTSIGNNCVIGAGVVIKGIIPSNSIVTNKHTDNIKIRPIG